MKHGRAVGRRPVEERLSHRLRASGSDVASPMPRTPYVEVPMNARDIMTPNLTTP